jgi:hypothetical protein
VFLDGACYQGNVEYKLKLTDVSPARFARLVTQLNWRLLEGGGQAYYELGVADSGALIGLSRSDLEQSLQTLDMMAGEIGASVIVVKEIEVPPAMVALADKVSAYIDPQTGEWTEKMCNRRRRTVARDDDSFSPTPTSTESEPDMTDTDEGSSLISTPNFPAQLGALSHLAHFHRSAPSYPNCPTAQSSPSIEPLDDDLALFSMEPEPAFGAAEELVELDPANSLPDVPHLSLDIEITPVYKPRPVRAQTLIDTKSGEVFGRPARRLAKQKEKKTQPLRCLINAADGYVCVESGKGSSLLVPNKQESKALLRRMARDRRREERRETANQLTAIDTSCSSAQQRGVFLSTESQSETLPKVAEPAVERLEICPAGTEAESKEPRLIVEALVVRKRSLEEEFLDFGSLGSLPLS